MRRDAIFRIASMSKPVTSVAVMMLVAEGKLKLSDPLARYAPAFERARVYESDDGMQSVPVLRPITISDLLTHTSGIAYPDTVEARRAPYREASLSASLLNDHDEPMVAMVERMAGIPLAAQPGDKFVYGYSTDVLGVVVEQVSGLTLDEFLQRRIFEPLGMIDTHSFLPPTKTGRLAAIHMLQDDGNLVRGGAVYETILEPARQDGTPITR